jgi:nucleoside-triphosphatase
MTHIFLTGDIQIGKIKVIRKALLLLKPPDDAGKPFFGGFRTYFGPDRADSKRFLYMNGASSPPIYDEQHAVARFREGRAPKALPGRFDALGVKFISEARKNARVIVMDECGGLEREARAFQNEVLDALKGDIPVLGVVKAGLAEWTNEIRRHPKVRLLTVDRSNRDMLPLLIAENMRLLSL